MTYKLIAVEKYGGVWYWTDGAWVSDKAQAKLFATEQDALRERVRGLPGCRYEVVESQE